MSNLLPAQSPETRLTLNLRKFSLGRNIRLSGQGINQSLICDSTRTATFILPLTQSGFYLLSVGPAQNEIYLEPGANLQMEAIPNADGEFNLVHLDFRFNGVLAGINTYLNQRKISTMEDKDFLLSEAAYIEKMKKLIRQNTETVKRFRLGKAFEQQELLRIRFATLEPATRYPVQHFWKNGNEVSALYKVDRDTPLMKQYIASQFIDTTEAWKDATYRNYVKKAVGILAMTDFGTPWPDIYRKRIQVIEKYFHTPVIVEDMVQALTLTYVEATQGKPLGELQSLYDSHVHRTDYHQAVQKQYALWQKFQKGEKLASATATYRDKEGKSVSLDDLKGTYLYIDIWATWCGPCRAEIPHLKKLEEAFKGKNIRFVSISMDARRNDWLRMVEKEQLGGIQLLGGPNAPIAKEYQITGIPRFLLLDREGKLIDGDMSRPSDPRTKQTLDKLEGI